MYVSCIQYPLLVKVSVYVYKLFVFNVSILLRVSMWTKTLSVTSICISLPELFTIHLCNRSLPLLILTATFTNRHSLIISPQALNLGYLFINPWCTRWSSGALEALETNQYVIVLAHLWRRWRSWSCRITPTTGQPTARGSMTTSRFCYMWMPATFSVQRLDRSCMSSTQLTCQPWGLETNWWTMQTTHIWWSRLAMLTVVSEKSATSRRGRGSTTRQWTSLSQPRPQSCLTPTCGRTPRTSMKSKFSGLQFCCWQYGSIFICSAVVTSQICEIMRNS